MPDPSQVVPGMLPTAQPLNSQSPVQQFFTDPKNLATGLVFLAALAQGRRPGQSTAGQVGERALGALAFRGGLDRSLRNQRIQDTERADSELQQSRQNEIQQRQVAIGEQGLQIKRDDLSQAARLAAAENASRESIASNTNKTQKDIAQMNIDAGRWDRTHSGTDHSPLGGEGLQKLIQAQWEQELKDASLQGRPPDAIKMANSVADLMQAWSVLQPGANLTRLPDGSIARVVPRPGDGQAQPGGPAPLAPPPVETPRNPQLLTPTDLAPAAVRPKGRITPEQAAANEATHQTAQLATQSQAFTSADQINQYINRFGAKLTKDQLKALTNRKREILNQELQQATSKAYQSSRGKGPAFQ